MSPSLLRSPYKLKTSLLKISPASCAVMKCVFPLPNWMFIVPLLLPQPENLPNPPMWVVLFSSPFSGCGRGLRHGSSPGRYLSQSQPSSSPQGRPHCQICSKPGHLAIDCYNRLNMNYQGRNPSRQLSAMHITTDPSTEWLTAL